MSAARAAGAQAATGAEAEPVVPTGTESSGAAAPEATEGPSTARILAASLLVGVYFGVVLVKSELVAWYRIQEMFRFGSFHVYGILLSAVAVAALSLAWLRRRAEARGRPSPVPPPKDPAVAAPLLGGTCFGLGWALLGACPGPIYALIGTGVTVMVVALAAAVAGAWAYGHLRPWLPH